MLNAGQPEEDRWSQDLFFAKDAKRDTTIGSTDSLKEGILGAALVRWRRHLHFAPAMQSTFPTYNKHTMPLMTRQRQYLAMLAGEEDTSLTGTITVLLHDCFGSAERQTHFDIGSGTLSN